MLLAMRVVVRRDALAARDSPLRPKPPPDTIGGSSRFQYLYCHGLAALPFLDDPERAAKIQKMDRRHYSSRLSN